MVSPLLAGGRHDAGAVRHSAGGESAGRGSGFVSRQQRRVRFARPALPASRHLAGIWRHRRWRDCAVLIMAGCSTFAASAWRCPAEPKDSKFPPEGEASRLSGARAGRAAVRLYGSRIKTIRRRCRITLPLMDRGGQRQVEPVRQADYNWFNFFENSADPVHVCVLHRHAGYGQQSWGDHFFSYTEMPQFRVRRNGLRHEGRDDQAGTAAGNGIH